MLRREHLGPLENSPRVLVDTAHFPLLFVRQCQDPQRQHLVEEREIPGEVRIIQYKCVPADPSTVPYGVMPPPGLAIPVAPYGTIPPVRIIIERPDE